MTDRDAASRVLGDFLLLDKIGEGGMGKVYRARQKSLGREVALKVLSASCTFDPEAVLRFRREAESTARLRHPGIVPVHAVGHADGMHYFAMELVEGVALDRALDALRHRPPRRLQDIITIEAGIDGPFPELRRATAPIGSSDYVACCASIAADLANALAAAHGAGVVHRDLKPSNVLIRTSGKPVLVDFGLARIDRATRLTRTGEMMGTPAYVAPEQAAGRSDADARVDVYGLGAILYDLLTLRPPHEGDSVAEILGRIGTCEPKPVRRWNREVPADLESIVHRCLETDPDRRYPCIEAVENELRSFLRGDTVHARQPGRLRRMLSGPRRHRRASLAALGTLVLAGTVFTSAAWFAQERSREQGNALLEEARDALVIDSDAAKAIELHGRAAELLHDPEALRAARLELTRHAFERLYPSDLEALEAWIRFLPAADRALLGDIDARVAGRGRMRIDALRRSHGERITARWKALRQGDLDTHWSTLTSAQPLPLGEYLVEVASPDGRRPRLAVRLERDADIELPVELLACAAPPSGYVQVTDPTSLETLAASLTELTWGEYRAWLANLQDEDLRALMQPHADTGSWRPDEPVRGLSYAQARAAAAHFGAHLPTPGEFLLSASSGLRGLQRPYGREFDSRAMVADHRHRSGPEPASDRRPGATPLGLIDVFGNIAEIIAAENDGRLLVAGGHYHQQDPAALLLTDPESLYSALASRTTPNRYAGLRLYRFLGPASDPPAAVQAERTIADLLAGRPTAMMHDWQVRPDGLVDHQLTLAGFNRSGGSAARLQLATPGFVQLHPVTVHDGHDRELSLDADPALDGESAVLNLRLAEAPRGHRYQFSVRSRLTPAGGLRGRLDGYEMLIPITTTGAHDLIHRVRLPGTCRVVHVSPEPWRTFHTTNETHVIWRRDADGRPHQSPAHIRFRIDGALTDSWPVEGTAVRVATEFLEAWDRPTPTGCDSSRTRPTCSIRAATHPVTSPLPAPYPARASPIHACWTSPRWDPR